MVRIEGRHAEPKTPPKAKSSSGGSSSAADTDSIAVTDYGAGYFEGGNISTGAVNRDSRRPAKPKAKPAAKALRHLDLLRCQWLQDLQVLVELVADLWGYRGRHEMLRSWRDH